MKVALVTCQQPPEPDPDAPLVAAALATRGHTAQDVAWDAPEVDWSVFDVALLRSTWNYHHDRDAFLGWASRTARVTRLLNPLPTVVWNTHKFYLRDLASRGAAIFPTEFVPAGSRLGLALLLENRGWDAAVLKPAVSANAFATLLARRDNLEDGQAHLDRFTPHRDMLVQRYMPTVVEPGERCLIWVDGEFSHAVRKHSLFDGSRAVWPEGVPVEADRDEIAAARFVLDCLDLETPLYARIDLLRDESGIPRLMELELVEPSLFIATRPEAATQLVAALEARSRA
jgi:hypothetical protein